MQIKDVHVIFHLLVSWFIQKSGKYAHKASESVPFVKKYFVFFTNDRTQL